MMIFSSYSLFSGSSGREVMRQDVHTRRQVNSLDDYLGNRTWRFLKKIDMYNWDSMVH